MKYWFILCVVLSTLSSCELAREEPTGIPVDTPTTTTTTSIATSSPLPVPTDVLLPVPLFVDESEVPNEISAQAQSWSYPSSHVISCSDMLAVDTAVYSQAPVTGTMVVTITLYDSGNNRLGNQQVRNFTTQNTTCAGVYREVLYTWDKSLLTPGKVYSETIQIANYIEHTQPISVSVNGQLVPATDVMGWYMEDNSIITYRSPNEEVFLKSFVVSGQQIFLPIVFRN